MHTELLTGSDDAGRLREQLVWVGRSGLSPLGAAHIAPEAEDVPAAMEDLLRFVAREDLPALVHAAIAHAQFETIHPFTDGNGRTGRALVHAMLSGKGLLSTTAPVSAGLLTDLTAYTSALTAFRGDDARPIVEQFARAARYAAVTGTRLVDGLFAQLEEDRGRLRRAAGGDRPLAEPGMAAPRDPPHPRFLRRRGQTRGVTTWTVTVLASRGRDSVAGPIPPVQEADTSCPHPQPAPQGPLRPPSI